MTDIRLQLGCIENEGTGKRHHDTYAVQENRQDVREHIHKFKERERERISKERASRKPFRDIRHEEMHARRRAGRQVPIRREDRHFSGCQLVRRVEVFVKTAGTHGASSACLPAPSGSFDRATHAVRHRSGRHQLPSRGRHPSRSLRLGRPTYTCRLLSPLCCHEPPALVEQDFRRSDDVRGGVLTCCAGNHALEVTNKGAVWVHKNQARKHALEVTNGMVGWVHQMGQVDGGSKAGHVRAFEEALGRVLLVPSTL